MNDDPIMLTAPGRLRDIELAAIAPTEPSTRTAHPGLNSPSRRAARGSTMSMPPIPALPVAQRKRHDHRNGEASQDRREAATSCATAQKLLLGDAYKHAWPNSSRSCEDTGRLNGKSVLDVAIAGGGQAPPDRHGPDDGHGRRRRARGAVSMSRPDWCPWQTTHAPQAAETPCSLSNGGMLMEDAAGAEPAGRPLHPCVTTDDPTEMARADLRLGDGGALCTCAGAGEPRQEPEAAMR